MTAYNGKKKTASASITVYITKKPLNAKKVKITGKKTLKVGKRICLTAKLTSSKATENVVWTCSNYAVANVDAYGVVTAYKKGKIKITAKTMSGKQKTFKITVKK